LVRPWAQRRYQVIGDSAAMQHMLTGRHTGALVALVAVLAVVVPAARSSADPGAAGRQKDAEGAAAELIGAPVFAADGKQIGRVADVATDAGEPQRLRFTTGAMLGIGERTLEVPRGNFTVLRGAVVVDLPSEAVDALPEAPAATEGE
jgi:hypothetical protein